MMLMDLGVAYAGASRSEDAERIVATLQELADLQSVSVQIGIVYGALGEFDEAFEWFDRGYVERSPYLLWLKALPWFQGLHDDPRFVDLVDRVGLP